MKRFTLIAYKPGSDCCHGGSRLATYTSDLQILSNLTVEELEEHIAELRTTKLDCCESGYEEIQFFEQSDTFEFHNGIAPYKDIKIKMERILTQRKAQEEKEAAEKKIESKKKELEAARIHYEELKKQFEK